MNSDKSFGTWLQDFRKRRNHTQEKLACKLDYSAEYIRKLESDRRPPTVALVSRLADFQGLEDAAHEDFVKFVDDEFGLKRKKKSTSSKDKQAQQDPAPGIPPYKGLTFFEETDAHLYFGRQTLIHELISLLSETDPDCSHFLAVIGASGSGKSSLVRAGLIPTLKQGQRSRNAIHLPSGSEQWRFHIITPASHPLENLAVSLTEQNVSVTATTTLIDDLWQDPRNLHLYARRLVGENNRLFLVIDQFEELFTLCRDKKERKVFIENLCYAAKVDGVTSVVIALRADFYRHCLDHDPLRLLLERHTKTIGSMSRAELHAAIVGPAKDNGWSFEAGLVDLFLDDVGDEPGALPLLAHALRETWERRQGYTLTFAGYIDIGRVQGAIATTAERVFSELNNKQKMIAKKIFLRLTELGEASEDTRRRAQLTELLPTDGQRPSVEHLLKMLADVRLITTHGDEVEVAHEALIREWPLLRTWLVDNREGLRIHRHLTDSTKEWQNTGFDESMLYRGIRLKQALTWAEEYPDELSEQERKFLDDSRLAVEAAKKAEEEARNRELEHQRLLVKQEAVQAIAIANARLATAERLAMQAKMLNSSTNPYDLDLALLLASHAVRATLRYDGYVLANADLALAESINAAQRNQWHKILELPHISKIFSIAYSPDSQLLVSAGDDPVIRIWDTKNGKEICQLMGHTGTISSVTFSLNSRLLASASTDGTVRIWDVNSSEEIHQLVGHTRSATSAMFSPDGQHIVSASADQTVRIWDITTGNEIRRLEGHEAVVWSAEFSPDGQLIISASADETVRIWKVASGEVVRQLIDLNGEVRWAKFSPDGQQIMGGGEGRRVRTWNVASGKVLHAFYAKPTIVRSAAYSPDGQQIVGAADDTVHTWSVTSEMEIRQPINHTSEVKQVAIRPDGQQIATGSEDGVIHIWKMVPKDVRQFLGHEASVRAAIFSSNGKQIISASEDTTVRIWNVKTAAQICQLDGHEANVRTAVFSPSGQQIVSASQDSTVRIWDVKTARQIGQLMGHIRSVWSALFSPDGQYIVSTGEDTTVRLWALDSGIEVRKYLGHEENVWSVAFSLNGQQIVSASKDRTARIWDVKTGQQICQLTGHVANVWSASFSPDGQQIVSASEDGTVRIWDAASGKEVYQFIGHTSSVRSAAFSPDGHHIVSAGDDKTVRMWNMASGKEVRQLIGHTERVLSVAYSSDGQHIVSASADKTIRLWTASIDELLAQAKTLIQRNPPSLTIEERQLYDLE